MLFASMRFLAAFLDGCGTLVHRELNKGLNRMAHDYQWDRRGHNETEHHNNIITA